MSSSFKLSMHLGASLGGSVRSSFSGVEGQLNKLGSSISRLKNQQKSIRNFEMSTASVEKSRLAYNKARLELNQLKKEFRATDAPSKTLTSNLDKAQKKVDELSQKLERQRGRLSKAGRAMSKAGVSTGNLRRDNHRLGQSVDRLSAKYKKLGNAIEKQRQRGARRSELRGQLFDTVAVGAVISAPIAVAINFEAGVSKLGAMTRTEGKVLDQLSAKARALGEETQFSATQAVGAMNFLGMAGFKPDQILSATPGVLNLAQAAGEDLGRTADISSNILSGFNLQADQMDRVGDVLTATFTRSNVNLSMLGETMKFVAPVAASTGASIEQVAAMAGKLGDAGIQGGRAGTVLRASFLRLASPTGAASDAIKELGVDVQDEFGNLRSVPEIFEQISGAMAGMGSAQKTGVVKTIFGEEAASGVIRLLDVVKKGDLTEFIATLENANGEAAKVAADMANNTKGALKLLGSAVEGLSISIGSTLLPIIQWSAKAIAKMASGLSKLATEFPLVTTVVAGAVVGLVALRAITIASMFSASVLGSAIGSLSVGYTFLTTALSLTSLNLMRVNALSKIGAVSTGLITTAQWAWNVAMTANPIGLIIVGIGAVIGLGVLLIKNWETVSRFFGSMWEGLKEMTGNAVSWLLDNIGLLLNPFALLTKVATLVGGALFGEDVEGGIDNNASTTSSKNIVKTAAVGSALEASTALATPLATTSLPDVAAQAVQQTQNVRLDAPITINAAPGMDAQAIAREVQRELSLQGARLQQERRSSLFDLS